MKNLKSLLCLALLFFFHFSQAQQTVGVNTHGVAGTPISLIKNMGAQWARVSIHWSEIEKTPNNYDFSWTDYMLKDLKVRGMKVLFILYGTPAHWSSNGKENGLPNTNAWKKYVYTVAKRYGNQVDAWEVWNEPNLREFFDGTTRDYVFWILKPASRILRAQTPNIPIAAPGITHIYKAEPRKFLKDMKRYGADKDFDILSYHLYSASKPIDFQRRLYLSNHFKYSVLKVVQDAKMMDKPFWLTEYGCDETETGSESANANCLYEMTKILQSQSWVKGFFIYSIVDDPRYDQQFRWGLLRPNFSPKPAVSRLKPLF